MSLKPYRLSARLDEWRNDLSIKRSDQLYVHRIEQSPGIGKEVQTRRRYCDKEQDKVG